MHSRSGLELPTTQYLSKSPQTTVSSTRQQVPGTYSSLTSTRHSRSSTRFQVYDNDFLAVHGVQAQDSSYNARGRAAAGGFDIEEGGGWDIYDFSRKIAIFSRKIAIFSRSLPFFPVTGPLFPVLFRFSP